MENDSKKETNIIKMSDISIQPFTNKKGQRKFQLSLSEEYLTLLLNGDINTITYIKSKLQ